jgi:hypothetical protein
VTFDPTQPDSHLAVAGPRKPPFRPEKSAEERRAIAAERECVVLWECLRIASDALRFYDCELSRASMKQMAGRLRNAGLAQYITRLGALPGLGHGSGAKETG